MENINGKIIGIRNVDQLKLFHLRPNWVDKSISEDQIMSECDSTHFSDNEINNNPRRVTPNYPPGIVDPDLDNDEFEINHDEI